MINSDGAPLGTRAAQRLKDLDCFEIGTGLTDAEFSRVGGEFGIEFADDHRAFLAAGLPLDYPPKPGQTWREPWPTGAMAILTDFASNSPGQSTELRSLSSTTPSWGDRPNHLTAALAVARNRLDD